jgi:metallo-beta-lactamase class B
MFGKSFLAALAALTLLGATAPLASKPASEAQGAAQWAAQCKDWDEWDKSGPPFRIHGNTYYVGTCGISAILIADKAGHVLIDTGTEAGARIVARNIAQLGFKVTDVRYIVSSHEHFDHVGGLALMKELSGAEVIASPKAAAVLATGEADAEDPQHGLHPAMRPVKVDRVLDGNTLVESGDVRLRAIPTPGHTPGALSWMWRSCAGGPCEDIVYADSLSPISSDSYRFSDHPVYLLQFHEALERVRMIGTMGCTILLTPHPSASGIRAKLHAGDITSVEPGCTAYADGIKARLDARLAKEAAAPQ